MSSDDYHLYFPDWGEMAEELLTMLPEGHGVEFYRHPFEERWVVGVLLAIWRAKLYTNEIDAWVHKRLTEWTPHDRSTQFVRDFSEDVRDPEMWEYGIYGWAEDPLPLKN